MIYHNAYIYRKDRRFEYGNFSVREGRFAPAEDALGEEKVDLRGSFVIPGLVDIHTHGCAGADFSDGDLEGLRRMGDYYARHGITAFAPSSVTLPYEKLEKAFDTAVSYRASRRSNAARLPGIHMEGPFFSEKKKGAQNGAFLKLPDYEAFRRLNAGCGGLIRIVDVAAELEGAADFAEKASKDCTVSIAHTDAD